MFVDVDTGSSKKRRKLNSENSGEREAAGTGVSGEGVIEFESDEEEECDFAVPEALTQGYVICPTKRRLMVLMSLIHSLSYNNARFAALQTEQGDSEFSAGTTHQQLHYPFCGTEQSSSNCKMVIFFSNCDSVEYHHRLLLQVSLTKEAELTTGSHQRHAGKAGEFAKKRITHKKGNASKPTEDDAVNDDQYVFATEFKVFKLHGSISQLDRTKTYREFRKASNAVLLCTDVAARGLDLPGINWVVQYDTPDHPKEYIHRVGRTARAGHGGSALMFLMPSEAGFADVLQSQGLRLQAISFKSIIHNMAPQSSRTGKIRRSEISNDSEDAEMDDEGFRRAIALQSRLENIVELSKDESATRDIELDIGGLHALGARAFLSTCRAYATHAASLRHIFHPKFLHFGHFAKAFALKDSPSSLVRYLFPLVWFRSPISPDVCLSRNVLHK